MKLECPQKSADAPTCRRDNMHMHQHAHAPTCTCTNMYMHQHAHAPTCTCTNNMYMHQRADAPTCRHIHMSSNYIQVYYTCTYAHAIHQSKVSSTKANGTLICQLRATHSSGQKSVPLANACAPHPVVIPLFRVLPTIKANGTLF
jgi:hypothetical protein